MKHLGLLFIVLFAFISAAFFYGYSGAWAAATSGSNLKGQALKIMNAQGCLGCHVINGAGGAVGPNLSKEGAKGHSIHWLEVQIKDPAAHNPSSIMPQFHLKASQLETVAGYLDSLK